MKKSEKKQKKQNILRIPLIEMNENKVWPAVFD